MNARVAFDTHAFVKRLEEAGMSAAQAEALANALGEIVLDSVATNAGLQEVDRNLRAELRELEHRLTSNLTTRMGSMIAASTALTVAILGVLVTMS
jgi:triphosphoribosyl-dephospho-CoA synthetase